MHIKAKCVQRGLYAHLMKRDLVLAGKTVGAAAPALACVA